MVGIFIPDIGLKTCNSGSEGLFELEKPEKLALRTASKVPNGQIKGYIPPSPYRLKSKKRNLVGKSQVQMMDDPTKVITAIGIMKSLKRRIVYV